MDNLSMAREAVRNEMFRRIVATPEQIKLLDLAMLEFHQLIADTETTDPTFIRAALLRAKREMEGADDEPTGE